MRLEKEERTGLPTAPADDITILLYVFQGNIQVNNDMMLATDESVLIEAESPVIPALKTSEVFLLMTQTNTYYFNAGMYSENLQR